MDLRGIAAALALVVASVPVVSAQSTDPSSGRHACAALDNTTRILSNDIQTPFDTLPDFSTGAQIASVAPGNWSSNGTWSLGRPPLAGERVIVRHNVRYDAQSTARIHTISIQEGGTLAFATNQSTKLVVGNLLVKDDGTLEIGREGQPVPFGVSAELLIADQALDTSGADPRQYGTGIIVLGTIRTEGMQKTPYARLTGDLAQGASVLTLQTAPTGWRVGDRVVLPDTHDWNENEYWWNYVSRAEVFVITAISPDGLQITLDRPATHEHPGARDGNGLLTFTPFVANLDRTVRIASENRNGVRGHMLLTYRASVKLHHTLIEDMGRTTDEPLDNTTFDSNGQVTHIGTNQIGRYPIHLHHLYGPPNPTNTGYQYEVVGNAVVNSEKWPITVHDSHFGLIQNNVVYEGTGSGVMTEDGNETANVFEGNIVMHTHGPTVGRSQDGRDGGSFWFWGFSHIVRNNVAVSFNGRAQDIVAGAGYSFNWTAATSANTKIPLFRGADLTQEGQFKLVDMQQQKILEFSDNEAVGGATGLVFWHRGTSGYSAQDDVETTLVKNLRCWHVFEECFFGYPSQNVVFDGMVVRSNPATPRFSPAGNGFRCGDYWCRNITIRNADIQGAGAGIIGDTNTNGQLYVVDSYLRNITNIRITTPATPGTRAAMPDRVALIENVRFDGWPGRTRTDVARDYSDGSHANLRTLNRVLVYDYNGTPGDNFQLFLPEQDPNFIMAQTAFDPQFPEVFIRLGSPDAGRTNADNLARYGITTSGELATCSTTRPLIAGFACPVSNTPPLDPRLTIILTGTGGGRVTSGDGFIDCGTQCSHTYQANATVTLNVTPDPGSEFAGFTGEGCGTAITLTRPVICEAMFNLPGTGPGVPEITAQPQSTAVFEGASASFSVTATGSVQSYQWQRDGQDIPGANAATYTLPFATVADSGAVFRVIVGGSSGSVTSADATLTVVPAIVRMIGFTAKPDRRNPMKIKFTAKATSPFKIKRYYFFLETDLSVLKTSSRGTLTYTYKTPGPRIAYVVAMDKRGNMNYLAVNVNPQPRQR